MSTFPTITKIARILDSERKHQAAELIPYLPVAYGHSRDWADCTIATIGLPDPDQVPNFAHSYILGPPQVPTAIA